MSFITGGGLERELPQSKFQIPKPAYSPQQRREKCCPQNGVRCVLGVMLFMLFCMLFRMLFPMLLRMLLCILEVVEGYFHLLDMLE